MQRHRSHYVRTVLSWRYELTVGGTEMWNGASWAGVEGRVQVLSNCFLEKD